MKCASLWTKLGTRISESRRSHLLESQKSKEKIFMSRETRRLTKKLSHLATVSKVCNNHHCCWKVVKRYEAEKTSLKNNIHNEESENSCSDKTKEEEDKVTKGTLSNNSKIKLTDKQHSVRHQ